MRKRRVIRETSPHTKAARQVCDQRMVAQFDYSRLSDDFLRLAKPAQRALINNGILAPADLARRTFEEVSEFHGIGPSAIPILQQALRKNGLRFRGA